MNYIQGNKQAWEEAFEHKHANWGDDNYKRLLNEEFPFFLPDMVNELETFDFTDKDVAHFCCNNGRELLSLVKSGVKSGVGFDIAENIIGQAMDTAAKAGIRNCKFVSCNILDIPAEYHRAFDFIMFTIGALTWFEDLKLLFQKVSDCLRPNGILYIHECHPFMNMLPTPDEDAFDKNNLDRICYPYFNHEPWIENEGMGYMSEQYASKTFTSFAHTLSSIVNAISKAGMRVFKLNEYDYDIGLTDVYDGKEYPLSYLLLAEKAD